MENKAAVEKLRTIKIPGVELFVEPVKEHRFVLVIRGEGLGDRVNDTDPQAVGVSPLKAEGADEPSKRTAAVVNQFVAEAVKVLADQGPISGATLRGFATYPKIATFADVSRRTVHALARPHCAFVWARGPWTPSRGVSP